MLLPAPEIKRYRVRDISCHYHMQIGSLKEKGAELHISNYECTQPSSPAFTPEKDITRREREWEPY